MNTKRGEIVLKQVTCNLSILVVETSDYIHTSHHKYLSEMFLSVEYAQNWASIEKIMSIKSVDIVLIDFSIQNSNPFDLASIVAKLHASQIVAISENVNEELLIKMLRSGYIVDFLQRPFRMIDVKNLITRLTDKYILENIEKIQNKFIINNFITPVGAIEYLVENFYFDVEIVNHYKGVPIFRNGVIVDLNQNELVVKSENIQQKIAEYSGHAIITSKYLSQDIYADIKYVDYTKQTIKFKNMIFIESYVHHRKNIRVAPDKSFRFVIDLDGLKYSFDIVNISMNYVLLSVVNLPNNFNINLKLTLHISFKVKTQSSAIFKNFNITTSGYIHDIFDLKGATKILLFFDLDSIDKHHFENYLYARSIEIVNEFKNILKKSE